MLRFQFSEKRSFCLVKSRLVHSSITDKEMKVRPELRFYHILLGLEIIWAPLVEIKSPKYLAV